MLDYKRTDILSVRIPKELKAYIATLAHKEQTTLSNKVNEILFKEYENTNNGK